MISRQNKPREPQPAGVYPCLGSDTFIKPASFAFLLVKETGEGLIFAIIFRIIALLGINA